MDNDYTKERELLERFKTGHSSDEENLRIDQAFNSFARSSVSPLPVADETELRDKIWNRLPASDEPAGANGRLWPAARRLWPRTEVATSRHKVGIRRLWLAAAAAVAAITLGVWLYYASSINGRHPELVSGSPLANDIAPGKNTATLTLANGKTIQLSDAKTGVVIDASSLKYSDGTSLLSSRANAKDLDSSKLGMTKALGMTSVSTPRGGQYQVVLPDGTKVWLNADSKLSFPSQFSGRERKVLLEGEAYFAVVHNAKQPFKVESRGQVVEDIGTEFNINAYAEEKVVKTTLVEGSASVSSLRGGTTRQSHPAITLQPNQQATVGQNLQIAVTEVDAANEVLWKAGKFSFKSEALSSIMRKIARWYDVEAVFEAEELKEIEVSGSVSRFANLSILLAKLEQTGGIRFKIEGKKVYISNSQ